MTTNLKLDQLAKELNIPNYVDARMRDLLVGKSVADYECGIINLQPSTETESYRICYYKTPENEPSPEICIGYSSYGDPIPNELKNYLGDKSTHQIYKPKTFKVNHADTTALQFYFN